MLSPVSEETNPKPNDRARTKNTSGNEKGRDRSQALRDFNLIIEYKHLKFNTPGGVLVVPSFDDLRLWHGTIFIRKSLYANAIFKFTVRLPPEYNCQDVWPVVHFTSKVFNPYVDYDTGELNLRAAFPFWDPSRHFMVTVLTFIKKIFYLKDFSKLLRSANREAHRLFDEDRAAYKRKVEQCVQESVSTVYDTAQLGEDSPIRFTQRQAAHDAVHKSILDMGKDGSITVRSKEDVLAACRRDFPNM